MTAGSSLLHDVCPKWMHNPGSQLIGLGVAHPRMVRFRIADGARKWN